MPLWQWSTTPANNASAGSINWAEGQPPSTVNDSARQMMADVAAWFAGPEWLNYGQTPTYVSATQFTLAGNQASIYTVGRRVRATVSAGTIYGTITASAYTSLTTVTVAWDSGSLDSGVSEVDVGIMDPTHTTLPSGIPATLSKLTVNASSMYLGGGSLAAEVDLIMNNANTAGQYFLNNSGLIGFYDLTRTILRFSSDTSGNFTAAGNITANSDERLKDNWQDVQPGFLEAIAEVQSGTFERIATGERNAGVTAQSLQKALPEAVLKGPDGFLSVAYGQAALVVCVELAREVLRLRSLLEPVK